jgi:hypothetical protein
MPSRGVRGLWLRGAAAVAASLLALSSTGALVTAAVVGPGSAPAIVLTDHGNGNGNGNGNGMSDGNGKSSGSGDSKSHSQPDWVAALLAKLKAAQEKSKPKPTPAPAVVHKPASRPVASKPATSHHTQSAAAPAAPAPTARVVVDSSDPAPFSAQAVSASEATRVLPVESLGPLSGISFGSGLFIWPLLLAVDVFALAVIARMALRRRLASPED